MLDHKDKWMKRMIEKHGSEDAVREFMRASAEKSKRNKEGSGGFAYLKKTNPERFKEVSAKGGKASRSQDRTEV